MITEIFREFDFEAAHFLPNVPDGHKCRNMHGHSYKVIICVRGPINRETGMIMDFGDLKKVMSGVLRELDHSILNSLIPNPTAENIAVWIAERVFLPGLCMVEVRETATSGARAFPC